MSNQMISCETVRGEFARLAFLSKEENLWRHVEACDDCMDAWLVFCLEQKPQTAIPESFAHRVASAYHPDAAGQVHRNILWTGSLALSAVALLVLLVMLDRQSSGVSFQVIVTMLALEASALVLWLGRTSSV